ncbi:hypothetical protein T310_4201 [Rasamsonia emersonii CBS 393.64]|uniref:Secreted protein n=1 Tax=Rasamsonia emersonii (strain ATCC 16479 / CBS 393.64 / IMI 116815) TaxID=1408163 RepID=A0A0F4YVA9_RASE3|nr:hypothetical protein T310_4201 [Rasamsonia emersonii CBS 393.64]KKA21776.1 hypothetical protein T310_4201 [Rasamsonia emersonii CBS 393.64]
MYLVFPHSRSIHSIILLLLRYLLWGSVTYWSGPVRESVLNCIYDGYCMCCSSQRREGVPAHAWYTTPPHAHQSYSEPIRTGSSHPSQLKEPILGLCAVLYGPVK